MESPRKFEFVGEIDRLRADAIREEMQKASGRKISDHIAHKLARAVREADAKAGLPDPLTSERT